MDNGFQGGHKVALIKSDSLGEWILLMSDPTVRKVIPSDLEFSNSLLQYLHHFNDHTARSGKLQIINMFRHDASQVSACELETKLWVDVAGTNLHFRVT